MNTSQQSTEKQLIKQQSTKNQAKNLIFVRNDIFKKTSEIPQKSSTPLNQQLEQVCNNYLKRDTAALMDHDYDKPVPRLSVSGVVKGVLIFQNGKLVNTVPVNERLNMPENTFNKNRVCSLNSDVNSIIINNKFNGNVNKNVNGDVSGKKNLKRVDAVTCASNSPPKKKQKLKNVVNRYDLKCRVCLKYIFYGKYYMLDAVSSKNNILIKDMMKTCVPEVNVDVVKNAIICDSCLANLIVSYNFKLKCLKTELNISKHKKQKNITDNTNLKLADVKTNEMVDENKSIDDLINEIAKTNENQKKLNVSKNQVVNNRKQLNILKYKKVDQKNNLKLKCIKCSKTFSLEHNLQKHYKRVHKMLKIYKCKFCGKHFTQIFLTYQHLTEVHAITSRQKEAIA